MRENTFKRKTKVINDEEDLDEEIKPENVTPAKQDNKIKNGVNKQSKESDSKSAKINKTQSALEEKINKIKSENSALKSKINDNKINQHINNIKGGKPTSNINSSKNKEVNYFIIIDAYQQKEKRRI